MIDLKNEYKNTRTGLIPKDWELTKLGKIVKFYDNKRKPIKESERKHGIYPYYGASGIIDYVDDYIFDGEYLLLAEDGANILTRNTPIAFKVSGKFWVNNHAHIFKTLNETDLEYVKYFLLFISYEKYNTSSAQPKLNRKATESIDIIMPNDVVEREKIGGILNTWDKAIELKQQLIDLKKEQKKGLMQKLLTGEVRLPGFSSKWEEKNLKDISNITMGQSPKSKSYNSASEGLPLIQGNADIKNRKTNPSNWTTQVTKECNVGDIILTVRAPVGTVAKSIHNACIGRGVCAIKAKNCQMFLYQVLLLLEKKWVNLSQGSTFESINSTEIRNFKISIPTPKEQAAIARVLSRADNYIELLENEVEILKEQKQGLMQQLLTGQTRVKV